uniref:Malectin-like domain-containing protein n=1 Tax=Aegilops tauschii subsp. strangulata TaxID=200361 RepID=A0A452ZLM8_AEGTS
RNMMRVETYVLCVGCFCHVQIRARIMQCRFHHHRLRPTGAEQLHGSHHQDTYHVGRQLQLQHLGRVHEAAARARQELPHRARLPRHARGCYTLPSLVPGSKYLLRALFMYSNYDGLAKLPIFDLYLGVNFWRTVNISRADTGVRIQLVRGLLR